MKKLIFIFLVTGCAANMQATPTETLAVSGLQSRIHEIETAISSVTSDRDTANKILGIAFALVEVERAERALAEDAAKARSSDTALILSGTTWVKR